MRSARKPPIYKSTPRNEEVISQLQIDQVFSQSTVGSEFDIARNPASPKSHYGRVNLSPLHQTKESPDNYRRNQREASFAERRGAVAGYSPDPIGSQVRDTEALETHEGDPCYPGRRGAMTLYDNPYRPRNTGEDESALPPAPEDLEYPLCECCCFELYWAPYFSSLIKSCFGKNLKSASKKGTPFYRKKGTKPTLLLRLFRRFTDSAWKRTKAVKRVFSEEWKRTWTYQDPHVQVISEILLHFQFSLCLFITRPTATFRLFGLFLDYDYLCSQEGVACIFIISLIQSID